MQEEAMALVGEILPAGVGGSENVAPI